MNKRLKDKIALVTGGARGIGKGIAELFTEQGATVIIADILDEKENDFNPQVKVDYLRLDISHESSWLKIKDHIQSKYKKLNILVNNAGINGFDHLQDPESMSLDTWNYIHTVNLSSIFLGCKYAISMMKESRENCSIVNMSSRSGVVGVPNLAAYASSKAAIRNYSKSVAGYCTQKEYSIRCNVISPGSIDTAMWEQQKKDKDKFRAYTASLPLKRMGNVKEVAHAALYLASDESLYTTGTEILIEGGILATGCALPK